MIELLWMLFSLTIILMMISFCLTAAYYLMWKDQKGMAKNSQEAYLDSLRRRGNEVELINKLRAKIDRLTKTARPIRPRVRNKKKQVGRSI